MDTKDTKWKQIISFEADLAEVIKGDDPLRVGLLNVPDFEAGNLGTAGS